ncbi:MAG: glycosyltransferase family 2 protein [Candidatus Nanopelagicales bacterium]
MKTPWLSRVVGLLIAGLAIGAAVLLWLVVAEDLPINTPTPVEEFVLGRFDILYTTDPPPPRYFWGAIAVAALATSVVATVDWFWARRWRHANRPRQTPLAPKLVMAQTHGVFLGEVTVTTLIPAHNEQDTLRETLPALLAQSRPPDRVIVVADNCTDDTVAVARSFGVEVFETVDNTDKKAGALNQVLAWLLPEQGHNDVVQVMDADTALDPGFLEHAVRRFTDDRALMAIGGVFYGEPGGGLLGLFQRNEYVRYGRTIRRRRGKVFVLTGTSSMFRPLAMRTVAEHRDVSIPGVPGQVYDTLALTEDNEITIALKSLGALMVSPAQCRVVTEIMPTWGDLWRQRMRWQRGAVENIGAYGLTPATARYWAQQIGIGYGTIALAAYLALMFVLVFAADTWIWFPFWLGIGLVFVAERVVTVWAGGWRARLLAVTLFPELFYDLFLDVVFVAGLVDITLNRQARWGHVQRATAGAGASGPGAGRSREGAS